MYLNQEKNLSYNEIVLLNTCIPIEISEECRKDIRQAKLPEVTQLGSFLG